MWTCAGSGAERGSAIECCETCVGSGRLRRSTNLGSGRLLQIERCPVCAGTGRHVDRPCTPCCGAGRVTGRRAVEVRVPPGASDGDSVAVELEDRDARVTLRVRALPDMPLVRYAAAALLVAALAFLGFLLLP
jgi:DnaJ-class molecular chaperone